MATTANATLPGGTESEDKNSGAVMLLLKLRTLIALIIVTAYFCIMAPNFISLGNLVIISKHVALTAFLAIGMTYVIVTGGIDLSVGSTVGLVGMISGLLITRGIPIPFMDATAYPNVFEVIGFGLLTGIFVGLINGLLITKFSVAPFIATLGTMYIARGAALLISNGETFPNLVGKADLGNTGFPILGSGTVLGVPVAVILMAIVALAAAYVAGRTPLGRQIFAIGGNERASLLSGVYVNRVKVVVYVISGFCAAIVGLIISSQLVASHPATGTSFEMNAIAAAVLGGTSLAGGRGTIGGTIIGAFVIGVLSDGLVMMGVSEFWQMVIKGLVIIAAVVLDQMQRKMAKR